MKQPNGSGIAPLYAFAISLAVCANVHHGMVAWAAVWAVYAFRHMSRPRDRGAQLMNGEGSSGP